jgi:hypothetical protein
MLNLDFKKILIFSSLCINVNWIFMDNKSQMDLREDLGDFPPQPPPFFFSKFCDVAKLMFIKKEDIAKFG